MLRHDPQYSAPSRSAHVKRGGLGFRGHGKRFLCSGQCELFPATDANEAVFSLGPNSYRLGPVNCIYCGSGFLCPDEEANKEFVGADTFHCCLVPRIMANQFTGYN